MTGYEIGLERTAECKTAVVKANITWPEFKRRWRPMLDEVWAFLRSAPDLRTDGHNVMLYRDGLSAGEVDVEIGVQVTRSFEPAGRVVPSALPAGEAAVMVHTGAVSDIGVAHDAVRAWCEAQQLELTGVRWEIYGDPDPASGDVAVAVYWQLIAR